MPAEVSRNAQECLLACDAPDRARLRSTGAGGSVRDPQGHREGKFLACSGPPSLEYIQAGQDRMSFVTNLQRGQPIGIASPTAASPESCSVDAVFEHDRLVSSVFSGNLSMCQLVFVPCLPK
jgi:hypothetical protein